MTIFEDTKPATIDLAKARELLARAVETQGRDFVYKPAGANGLCHYFPQTDLPASDPRSKTGCLVGVALGIHGHDMRGKIGSVVLIAGESPGMMTDSAKHYFQTAQSFQDEGNTWGYAYDRAEARVTSGALLKDVDI